MNDEVKGYVMADKDAIEEYARIVAQAIHQAHDQHNETAVLDPVEYLTVDQEIRGLAIQAACSFGDTGGLRTALLRADLIAQYIKTGEIRIEGYSFWGYQYDESESVMLVHLRKNRTMNERAREQV